MPPLSGVIHLTLRVGGTANLTEQTPSPLHRARRKVPRPSRPVPVRACLQIARVAQVSRVWSGCATHRTPAPPSSMPPAAIICTHCQDRGYNYRLPDGSAICGLCQKGAEEKARRATSGYAAQYHCPLCKDTGSWTTRLKETLTCNKCQARKDKPKLEPPPLESEVQAQVVAYFQAYRIANALCFSVPGGMQASARQAAKAKRTGYVPGTPDLVFISPLGTWWLELKRERLGKLSKAQVALHAKMREAGAEVMVCYGLCQAIKAMEDRHVLRVV